MAASLRRVASGSIRWSNAVSEITCQISGFRVASGITGTGFWQVQPGVRGTANKAVNGSHPSSQAQQDADGTSTASFGFKEVPAGEKQKLVGEVFSSVASKYDVMNDIMSGGLHRLWKERLVQMLHPFPGMQHLDVAGGTGDVAFRVLRAIRLAERKQQSRWSYEVAEEDEKKTAAKVIVSDINPEMLAVGRERAKAAGLLSDPALIWLEGNAEDLRSDVADESMDSYSIAFGIRNVTNIDKALSEAYRVLKRGGHFVCLELSNVKDPYFRFVYDFYSFALIPAIGELVTGDRSSYQYLVESIRKFPTQEKFASMIREAGFQQVTFENHVGGVVAIHSGFKL